MTDYYNIPAARLEPVQISREQMIRWARSILQGDNSRQCEHFVEEICNQRLEGEPEGSPLFTEQVPETPIQQLENLISEYNTKYPLGEFMFIPTYSSCKQFVTGVLCWDWKKEIYHIESELIQEAIDLIKGLKKS